MKKTLLLLLLLMFSLSSCYINYIDLSAKGRRHIFKEVALEKGSSEKIAVIDVSGIITDLEEKDFLNNYGNKIEQLRSLIEVLRKDKNLRALVIKINSPGGEVTASDIMYHELLKLKEASGLVIVSSFLDVAASGAYYIAMASDALIAHPTTITGSIGVIQQMINAKGLLTTKLGIEDQSVMSGKNKDLGTPFKALTSEQQKLIQAMVDEIYENFLAVVKKGRPNIPEAKLRELADGRIFTAKQAKENGLVDEIGYIEDAIGKAAQLAKLEKPTVVMYETSGNAVNNIYSKPLESVHRDILSYLATKKSLSLPGFNADLLYLLSPAQLPTLE